MHLGSMLSPFLIKPNPHYTGYRSCCGTFTNKPTQAFDSSAGAKL